ncbi:MAG: cyclic nucleotide-binding domain-containing protein [Caldilineae bacterium]|nr:cyclic nucleotide-binding domain-containing protein [Chloroflexota bacterium]MCB9176706.1 cyclic nucleotide-binding domain-containing protein [Caldilineae bacterium]
MNADATPDLIGQLMGRPELAEAWQELQLAPGAVLFAQGDPGDAFYTVVEGRLEVHAEAADGSRVVLERIGPGQQLGELALVDGGARSAGVSALEPSRLRMLRREDFLEALPRVPALASMVIELLGTRMRRNAEYLGYVSRWARLVTEGDYAGAGTAIQAEAADHADPNMARFVASFADMIQSVQAREAALRQELQQLRIEIDRGKYEQQLAEVTESDFFRSLQSRSRDMRRRIRGEDEG